MQLLKDRIRKDGIVKQGNEDSFLAVTARGPSGYAAFVVLCDGMGGLSKGELASAEVVRAFSGCLSVKAVSSGIFLTLCITIDLATTSVL